MEKEKKEDGKSATLYSNESSRGKKVSLYVDFANVWVSSRDQGQYPNMDHILKVSKIFGNMVTARVYIALRVGEACNPSILGLEREGFEIITRFVPPTPYGAKKDVDTYLVTDFIDDMYAIEPDIMIIASDDSDYVPAIRKAKMKGIACIVLVSKFEKAKLIANAASFYYELRFPSTEIDVDHVPIAIAGMNENEEEEFFHE